MLRLERVLLAVLVVACGEGGLSTRGLITTPGQHPLPPSTGMIMGSIMGPDVEGNPTPVPGVDVIVFTVPGRGAMGAIVARRLTDSLGQFRVDSLAPASYGVAVNPPAQFAFRGADLFVEVTAGKSTSADFTLQRQ